MGYSYQFINGDIIYNAIPITSNLFIPWNYTNSILLNLWNSTNILWVDSKETRSINTTLQKIVSKGYNNNILIIDNPNTTNLFSIDGTDTINMSNNSAIETSINVQVNPYIVLAFVITIPNITILETIIFNMIYYQ